MKFLRRMLSIAAAAATFSGCTIRLVAVVETEDAVYGTTKVEKAQKYDAKQNHLGFFESLMGTVNSDSLNALDRIVNGSPAPEPTPPPPALVTPLPPGSSVVVQP